MDRASEMLDKAFQCMPLNAISKNLHLCSRCCFRLLSFAFQSLVRSHELKRQFGPRKLPLSGFVSGAGHGRGHRLREGGEVDDKNGVKTCGFCGNQQCCLHSSLACVNVLGSIHNY